MASKKEKNKEQINKVLEWFIYLVGYTIAFVIVTTLFKGHVHIDSNNTILWSFIIVFIMSILNVTIKPVLVTYSMPLIGITFGLFYPFINVFLLKLIDWLLGKHFDLHNIFVLFFMAILLSIMNLFMESTIKKTIKKVKKHEQNSN